MRLQLSGNYSVDDFEKAVSTIVAHFKSNKISSFQHINIYLRTCVDGREVKLTNDGEVIEHLQFDFAERRPMSSFSEAVSIMKPHKIDFAKDEEE